MTPGLWFDLGEAVATAILWITGIVMFLVGAERAELALVLAFAVGLVLCLRIWWRGRRDPDGPTLLDFIHW